MKPFELIAALMHKQSLGALPLAKRMGHPKLQPSIHRFVRGVITNPAASTAAPLAKFFNLPLEAIYDEKVATRIGQERGLTVVQLPAVRASRKQADGSADALEFDARVLAAATRYAEMDSDARARFDALLAQSQIPASFDQKRPEKKQA